MNPIQRESGTYSLAHYACGCSVMKSRTWSSAQVRKNIVRCDKPKCELKL